MLFSNFALRIFSLTLVLPLSGAACLAQQNQGQPTAPGVRGLVLARPEAPVTLHERSNSKSTAEKMAPLVLSTADRKLYKDWTITADRIDKDEFSENVAAHGFVRVSVKDQNAVLFADDLVYDSATGMIDAKGHVAMMRNSQKITRDRFKFKIASDDYLITQSDVAINKPIIAARLKTKAESIRTAADRSALDKFLDDDLGMKDQDDDDALDLPFNKAKKYMGLDDKLK